MDETKEWLDELPGWERDRRERNSTNGRHVWSIDNHPIADKLATQSLEAEYFQTERDTRMDDTVQDLLAELKPSQREVLYKRFFDRMSFGEIAEERGCSRQAVQQQVKRALTNLTFLIADKGSEVFKSKEVPNAEDS